MSPLEAAVLSRFRQAIRYRAAAAGGIATQVFFGFILALGLEAFYGSGVRAGDAAGALAGAALSGGGLGSPGDPGIPSLGSMVSYIWLGQAFLVLMPWSPDPEVRDCIRTGSIGTELLKPLDLYSLWFAKALGLKSAQLSLRALPILLFAGLLLPALGLDEWRLLPPASLAHFLAFLLSLAAAILLCAAVVCVYDVLLFRSVSAVGSTAMVASLVALGSGILVPLPVLPPRMAAALRLLPFSGLGDAPFRFWTGTAPLASLPASLAHQLLWLLALALLGRAVVRRELLRLEVLGG